VHVRVTLPEDNWAELRDPGDLDAGDMADVRDAIKIRGTGGTRDVSTTSGDTVRMEIAMIAAVVTSWSLTDGGQARPVTPATVAKLKAPYFRPLRKAVEPHFAELNDDPNATSGGKTATA
jgi:hypothetical protein